MPRPAQKVHGAGAKRLKLKLNRLRLTRHAGAVLAVWAWNSCRWRSPPHFDLLEYPHSALSLTTGPNEALFSARCEQWCSGSARTIMGEAERERIAQLIVCQQ